MRKSWTILGIGLMLCFGLLIGCSDTLEEEAVEVGAENIETPSPMKDVTQANTNNSVLCVEVEDCIRVGDELVAQLREQFGDLLSDYETDEDEDPVEEQLLVTYGLKQGRLVDPELGDVDREFQPYQKDTDKHTALWELVKGLIPEKQLSPIRGFIINTDGLGGTLAHVEPDEDDSNYWKLAVDVVDAENSMVLKVTLLHEFAHILTLKSDQMDMNEDVLFAEEEDSPVHIQAERDCAYYYVSGMGCTREGSYLNVFYNQFWPDIRDEWQQRNVDKDEEELDRFFQDYEDQFVTAYAATNAEEDIAESWAYFVLSPRPEGAEIWEDKLLFFYDYPELVRLRAEILSRLVMLLGI